MKGKQPFWPENLMRRYIAPAARRAGITKHISWSVFRTTFSNLLMANNEDVKTTQMMMRHSSPRVTLDAYLKAVTSKKRAAQSKVVEMILPKKAVELSGSTSGGA
jgi:integrase